MKLRIVPLTIKAANAYVAEYHRHHKPVQGGLFAVGVANDSLCGVAIIGRPVARMLSDGFTAEVTRLCTDGTKNACSMLYGAAWRMCRAGGYRRLITYILDTELGTSLLATGWKCDGLAGGGSWDRGSRHRNDPNPTCKKQRWSRKVEEWKL